MAEITTIAEALATVTFLEGREPESNTDGTFATLARYRDGGIFAGAFSGTSTWERHSDEEVVQVLEGAATLSLITEAGRQDHAISAGTVAVVPTGVWHRFHAPDGVTLMTVTPQPTEHYQGEGEPKP